MLQLSGRRNFTQQKILSWTLNKKSTTVRADGMLLSAIRQALNVTCHSSFFATKINSHANVRTAFKILSFTQMLFARPMYKLAFHEPVCHSGWNITFLNGRIDKFSGGAYATPFRIIFKSWKYFLRAFYFIPKKYTLINAGFSEAFLVIKKMREKTFYNNLKR